MNNIVITSDQYKHLIPGFVERFNEHVGGKLIVLCYDPIKEKLPENVTVVSLGAQPEHRIWTTKLIPYFLDFYQRAPLDEAFVLWLEDYYIKSFDKEKFNEIIRTPFWSKIDLTDDRSKFTFCDFPLNCSGTIISAQTARYRTSLQAAVWRVGYFLRYLKPFRSAWEFELTGECEAYNDGATILGTKDGIVKYDNIMLRGGKRNGQQT